MAEENIYATPELVSLYCYVSKGTGIVEAIVTFNLFGMGIRKQGEWVLLKRTDPELIDLLNSGNYRVFKIDWDKEPITDADPADEGASDHQLVQAWDADKQLRVEDLAKYAHEINAESVEADSNAAVTPKE